MYIRYHRTKREIIIPFGGKIMMEITMKELTKKWKDGGS